MKTLTWNCWIINMNVKRCPWFPLIIEASTNLLSYLMYSNFSLRANNEPMPKAMYNLLVTNHMGITHRYRWPLDQPNCSAFLPTCSILSTKHLDSLELGNTLITWLKLERVAVRASWTWASATPFPQTEFYSVLCSHSSYCVSCP